MGKIFWLTHRDIDRNMIGHTWGIFGDLFLSELHDLKDFFSLFKNESFGLLASALSSLRSFSGVVVSTSLTDI